MLAAKPPETARQQSAEVLTVLPRTSRSRLSSPLLGNAVEENETLGSDHCSGNRGTYRKGRATTDRGERTRHFALPCKCAGCGEKASVPCALRVQTIEQDGLKRLTLSQRHRRMLAQKLPEGAPTEVVAVHNPHATNADIGISCRHKTTGGSALNSRRSAARQCHS